MSPAKAFEILVDREGGWRAVRAYRRDPTPAGQERPDLGTPEIADIAVIARNRKLTPADWFS